MGINFLIIGLATLVPLVMGFIWYNPKVMGKAWIKSTGLAEEELRKANMAVVFGLTILFQLYDRHVYECNGDTPVFTGLYRDERAGIHEGCQCRVHYLV